MGIGMRRVVCAVAIFIGLAGASSELLAQQVEIGTGTASQAHVVLYGVYHHRAKIPPSVYCDDQEVAVMKRDQYFTIALPPGKHKIASSSDKRVVTLDAAAGATYYIEVSQTNQDGASYGVEEVDEEKALKELASSGYLTAKTKAKPVDMTSVNRVFIGWVDINPGDYHVQGYETELGYADVISTANATFQKKCQGMKVLSGRSVTGAKDRNDTNTAGNDLYVKFSGAAFDTGYRLHLSMHFIDLKTNSEIGSVPFKIYAAGLCGLEGCMDKELRDVSTKLQEELSRVR